MHSIAAEDREATARLRKGETVGRPVGEPAFLASLEARSGRRLAPLKRGPKPRGAERDQMHCHRNPTVIRNPP